MPTKFDLNPLEFLAMQEKTITFPKIIPHHISQDILNVAPGSSPRVFTGLFLHPSFPLVAMFEMNVSQIVHDVIFVKCHALPQGSFSTRAKIVFPVHRCDLALHYLIQWRQSMHPCLVHE